MDNLIALLNKRVDKTTECWVWRGHVGANGNTRVTINGKQTTGRQLAFFVKHGEWADPAKRLRTSCNNKICCNPEHVLYFDEGERSCKDCGNSFEPLVHRSYLSNYCQDCRLVKRKSYYENKKDYYLEQNRKYHLGKKYGINQKDYDNMIIAQNERCSICYKVMENPHIDHCHRTGKIRGLLCFHCNSALGQFEDDIERIERAANYLRESANK